MINLSSEAVAKEIYRRYKTDISGYNTDPRAHDGALTKILRRLKIYARLFFLRPQNDEGPEGEALRRVPH